MMNRTIKVLAQTYAAVLLLAVGMGSAQAAPQDYTWYTITGDVLFANDPNLWGLTTGQQVEAKIGIFGDATADGTYSVDFLYVDLDGISGDVGLSQDDFVNSGVFLTLTGGAVSDFAFFNDPYTFESSFTQFSDGIEGTAIGEWSSIQQTAVPIPAAVWLFGSALAMLGWARRKSSV